MKHKGERVGVEMEVLGAVARFYRSKYSEQEKLAACSKAHLFFKLSSLPPRDFDFLPVAQAYH